MIKSNNDEGYEMALHGSAKRAAAKLTPTEAEAALGYEPRQGWDDGRILTQDGLWLTGRGDVVRVADMPADYAANAAAYLMDRAEGMKRFADSFHPDTSAWASGQSGEEFARASPLYTALIERSQRQD
ncbi:hypothetical protein LG293_17150 (plasmid) [Citricoccus nitrophenolicus]